MATKKKKATKKAAAPKMKTPKPKPETPDDVEKRLNLEQLTAQVGQMLGSSLKEVAPDLGFALLMFDYGDNGALAYCSSAKREDMLRLLDEFKEMLIADSERRQKAH